MHMKIDVICSSLCNDLPNSIKNITDINIFKASFKRMLQDECWPANTKTFIIVIVIVRIIIVIIIIIGSGYELGGSVLLGMVVSAYIVCASNCS